MGKPNFPTALRGLLGAFLGAFLAALLWYSTLWAAAGHLDGLGKLLLLPGFAVGPAACLGYWLFRGLRRRRFAYLATRLCAVLVLPLALPAALWLDLLPRAGSAAAAWTAVRQSSETAEAVAVLVISALLVTAGSSFFQKRLLRYTDPVWTRDPRRAAVEYAGGALYNCRPPEIPLPEDPIPVRFLVGSVLEVEGEHIRTAPSLRRGTRFSSGDVAGVVLGPGTGSNVLYDRQGRILAKFAWSMENSDLFAAYLARRGVPMTPVQDCRPPAGP